MQFLTDLQPDGAVLRFNSLLFKTLFQLYHNFCTEAPKKTLSSTAVIWNVWNRYCSILHPITTAQSHWKRFPELPSCSPNTSVVFLKNAWESPFWNIRTKSVCSKIYKDVTSTSDKISDILERHALPIISCSAECFLNGFMPPYGNPQACILVKHFLLYKKDPEKTKSLNIVPPGSLSL